MNDRLAENAMEKNSAVSIALLISVLIKGARHHAPSRKRLKIVTSNSCATRKAEPEAIAMRTVTSGPNSPMICVPISEQINPTTNPTNTTRRAAEAP